MFFPFEMYLCLQEDNEKHLMDCISHNLNIDMIFPRDWKGENEILSHRPSLLGMAAFYCAIKCFRLLIANGATITTKDEASTSIASFSAAGGSIDILTILNEFDVDFSNSLRYAAMYGKTEAFFWIYNNRFNQRELFQTIVLVKEVTSML
ncbi:ankyrin repeat domain protein [Tritrichomonas foetus]|uniref:Ankyrin repeat domain protein n=1 Tax=Tritrichomonas foetus TaxID=1144522 RepID=A0A1J4K988_9EUKA|nr:ankyrin repeat domain protein [Tritrichomonas foetus]|eukprot:OHT07456.1 ankyrin repeat domain protein [Tritrichomonas foetus]